MIPFNAFQVLSCGHETGGDIDEALRLACEEDNMEEPTPAQMTYLEKLWKLEFGHS